MTLTVVLVVIISYTINPNGNISNQPQQEIKISGYSSVYPALKVLASAYEAKNPNTKVSILTPTKSEVSIASVKNGLLDIGTLSRELKPEEKEGKLEYYLLAKDALLVATHPSVSNILNVSTEQLKGIYTGKIKNWKELGGSDAKIVILDRSEKEPAKNLLRKYYLGEDLKISSEAIVLRNESEVITAIENTPYSIGAFSLAYAISNNLSVNRLSLNGVEPSIKNIKNNKYKMVRLIGIMSKKSPKKSVQEFVNFAISQAGKEELIKSNFVTSTDQENR
ncbi:phosphate ABC transporter substrate-binding protein [Hapalosiphon sp. MRB220]|nr:phosphate ABC transporter substrate-binding protein [Hapalosiphon sp. MRB220]